MLPPPARISPGREVIVVNLSRGGALVEGVWRFRPGGAVDMHLQLASGPIVARGRVERCVVWALERAVAVRYRTAVHFERPMPLEPPRDALEGHVLPGLSFYSPPAAASNHPQMRDPGEEPLHTSAQAAGDRPRRWGLSAGP